MIRPRPVRSSSSRPPSRWPRTLTVSKTGSGFRWHHSPVLAALLLAALGVGTLSTAQTVDPARPALKPLRFDEDWRPLCNAQLRATALDRLKCVRIGPDATLSLGGEWRERFEAADNPGFGLRQSADSVLLHRFLLHGDLRLGEALRGFVQLGFYEQTGRNGPAGPFDGDRLDVAQAFVDVSATAAGGRATLRTGRQELSFGSGRLVAVREGPNARRAFDGARAFWTDGSTRIDAFALRPVRIEPGPFDDGTDRTESFWGVHSTRRSAGPTSPGIDIYYLGYDRDAARFAVGSAKERRHSIGARLFGRASAFDWDLEAVAQFGSFGQRDIRAWTVATDVGYRLESLPLSPRLGLKANIASGDASGADNRLGTFNALYPKLPYFSEANLIAPANLMDLQPSLSLSLTPDLTARVGWNGIWRHRMSDAIYTTPLVAIPGTAGQKGRFTGHQAIVGFEWDARPDLRIAGEYVHFEPGATLRRAGGKPVDFVTISAAYRF